MEYEVNGTTHVSKVTHVFAGCWPNTSSEEQATLVSWLFCTLQTTLSNSMLIFSHLVRNSSFHLKFPNLRLCASMSPIHFLSPKDTVIPFCFHGTIPHQD